MKRITRSFIDGPGSTNRLGLDLAGASPNVTLTGAGTRDVQILFDQGDHIVNGSTICKDASASSRYFSDVSAHVP